MVTLISYSALPPALVCQARRSLLGPASLPSASSIDFTSSTNRPFICLSPDPSKDPRAPMAIAKKAVPESQLKKRQRNEKYVFKYVASAYKRC